MATIATLVTAVVMRIAQTTFKPRELYAPASLRIPHMLAGYLARRRRRKEAT
jgi:hypothetical protein